MLLVWPNCIFWSLFFSSFFSCIPLQVNSLVYLHFFLSSFSHAFLCKFIVCRYLNPKKNYMVYRFWFWKYQFKFYNLVTLFFLFLLVCLSCLYDNSTHALLSGEGQWARASATAHALWVRLLCSHANLELNAWHLILLIFATFQKVGWNIAVYSIPSLIYIYILEYLCLYEYVYTYISMYVHSRFFPVIFFCSFSFCIVFPFVSLFSLFQLLLSLLLLSAQILL